MNLVVQSKGIQVDSRNSQFLTCTRPNLYFAANQVCQFLHCPRDFHFQVVKRILRFLKGYVDQGLWFKQGPLHLTAFFDVD